jgi:hypothetical protein
LPTVRGAPAPAAAAVNGAVGGEPAGGALLPHVGADPGPVSGDAG